MNRYVYTHVHSSIIHSKPKGGSNPSVYQKLDGFFLNVFTYNSIVCVHAKSLQSCLTLCNPMDHSPQGSFVHGILQARVPECSLPCILPGDLSNPRIEPTSLRSPALAGGFFTTSATWEASNTTGLFSLKKQGSPATRYSMDEPQRRSK